MNKFALVSLCFFLSGVSALAYEIVWARMLSTVFGASLYAVATISAVFLLGLALGARYGLTAARCLRAESLVAYGVVEMCVAAFGVGLPFVFAAQTLQPVWLAIESALPGFSHLTRFFVVSALLLPPTLLMGATFPLLVDAFKERMQLAAQQFYTVNTVGGACGALLAGYVLLPGLGLRMTSATAAVLNIIAVLIVLAVLRVSNKADVSADRAMGVDAAPVFLSGRFLHVVAFVSGLLLLVLQICWTRWFALMLGSSTYSFSLVLGIFLSSLGLGAFIVSKYLRNLGNQPLLMAAAYFAASVYILVVLYSANQLPWLFLLIYKSFSGMLASGYSFETSLLARAIVVLIVVAPPASLAGIVFPLLLGCAGSGDAASIGKLYATNTIGSLTGALAGGYFLIPHLALIEGSGILTTLLLCALLMTLVALWLFGGWTGSFVSDKESALIIACVAGFVALATIVDVALFHPRWDRAIMSAGASFYDPGDIKRLNERSFNMSVGQDAQSQGVAFYHEGLNTTVTVVIDVARNLSILKTDGKVEAAVPLEPTMPSSGADTVTHLLLGALPAVLCESANCHALVIGYGSGTTSGATLAQLSTATVKIAELEPAVYAADKFFRSSNGNPLGRRGRVEPLVNDGRYILSASNLLFDAIVCQPSDPWVSGASELFTADFWRLARSRLKRGGVMGQWVQMYSLSPEYFTFICRTFASAFPHCALVYPTGAGECLLLGFEQKTELTANEIAEALEKTARGVDTPAGYDRLADVVRNSLVLNSARLNALAMQGSRPGLAVNSDDHNIVEFAAAANAMTQKQNIEANIALVRKFSQTRNSQ